MDGKGTKNSSSTVIIIIVIIIAILIILGLSIGAFLLFHKNSTADTDPQSRVNNREEEIEPDSSEEPDTNDDETAEPSDVQTVGFKGYGLVDIPSDWVKFVDVDTGEQDHMQQYTSTDLKYIITIAKYDDTPVKAIQVSVGGNVAADGAEIIENTVEPISDTASAWLLASIYPDNTIFYVIVVEHNSKTVYISLETTVPLSEENVVDEVNDFAEKMDNIMDTLDYSD